MASLKFWIKERHNPQLGVYFTPMGQMTIKAARNIENTLYGYNIMRSFDTEETYKAEIAYLKERGETVQ